MAHEERKHKQQGKKKSNIKDKVKLMKKQTKKKITVYSSSDESNVPIPLDDISEYESSKDDSSLLSSNNIIVPSLLINEFAAYILSVIANAMSTFHSKTCIHFVARSTQADYISIENKDGCFSSLGRTGGKHSLLIWPTTSRKQNTNNQNTPYDYGSIMHYERTAFSIQPGLETITPIPDRRVEIGQRQGLSNTDILRINKLYGC
ncbi:hatching enzyme 1.2-like [Cyprinus carpio]|uniref:Hatching enzyme 1.2-like n=1 Tax=Cyprinus carpio TaxID=7962 RepID=A0A9Q9XP78_CYPCA|nr:hatching enzyme 1.2-like [Cyprinus carpio]